MLASAYARWRGSLPPAEVHTRLQQVLQLAELPPERFNAELRAFVRSVVR